MSDVDLTATAPVSPPFVPVVPGDASGVNVTATGSTTARTAGAWMQSLQSADALGTQINKLRAYKAFEFLPVGPAAWQVPVGTRAETITVVRAGASATTTMQAVEATVPANQARCTDSPALGLLIEPFRSQYLATPDNPPTQSFTVPTGALKTVAWIEGTGTAVLAQTGGTPTASGLPHTLVAGTPFVFDVSGGSGNATLSFTPTGTVTFAQVEWGGQNPGFPTSKMHVGGYNRPPDVVSFVNPIATTPCAISVTATPLPGYTWTGFVGNLWTSGVVEAANTARIFLGGNGYLYFDTYDAAATNKRFSINITHWAEGSTHEVVAVLEAGNLMSLWVDGFWQEGNLTAASGAGTPTTLGTPIYIGGQSNGQNMFGGVISAVRVMKSADPAVMGPPRLQPYQISAFGDSITAYGSPPYATTLAGLLGTQWKGTAFGYPGEWAAYAAWSWTFPVRASAAKYVSVLLGINDVNQGLAGVGGANTIAALTDIYDSARAAGMTVIPITVLPAGGQAFWTAAHESLRTAINVWIRAYGTANNVVVVDAALQFDDGTGHLKAIYDSGDHLHPNQAGYDALAALIAASGVFAP